MQYGHPVPYREARSRSEGIILAQGGKNRGESLRISGRRDLRLTTLRELERCVRLEWVALQGVSRLPCGSCCLNYQEGHAVHRPKKRKPCPMADARRNSLLVRGVTPAASIPQKAPPQICHVPESLGIPHRRNIPPRRKTTLVD